MDVQVTRDASIENFLLASNHTGFEDMPLEGDPLLRFADLYDLGDVPTLENP